MATSSNCPGCQIIEKGYTVYFSGELTSDFLENYVSGLPFGDWTKINEKMVWMIESVFYGLLDYLIQHIQSESVFAVEATRTNPLDQMNKMRKIQTFQEEREAIWIDQLIQDRSIKTHFQPIIMKSREQAEIVGYELLTRGIDSNGNLISPAVLFQAAKMRNRLFALDRVCRLENVRNSIKVKDKLLFINFLPTAIYVPEHCLQSTFQLINQIGVKPEQIVFEVVESEEITNVKHLKGILNYYKSHGFRFALDDVGAGYTSLKLLSHLEPDFIKLDMDFVRQIHKEKGKQSIARAVLHMAHELHSNALAEGIEEKDELDCLTDIGYQLFQGYYFGKPSETPTYGM